MTVKEANYNGGTSLLVTGCTAGTTFKFQVAAINSVGTSILSAQFTIVASDCTITHDLAFTQSPINYEIESAAVPFTIPVYTQSGCTSGTTIAYSYACSNTSDPTKNLLPTTIDLSGGSIFITDKTYVGNYACTVSAAASTALSVID